MNKKIIMFLMISIILLTNSFIVLVIANPFTNISVKEARKMILGNDYPNLVIIDLRPIDMFDTAHIPGAINVPFVKLPPPPDFAVLNSWIASPEGQSHLNDEIILYCIGGIGSPVAAGILDTAGFTKVYSMEGGFDAWTGPVSKLSNNQLSFKLLFQGFPGGESRVSGNNEIRRDGSFAVLGDYYIQIGAGGAVEDISSDYLMYEADMDWQLHTKDGRFNVKVTEILSIYSDIAKQNLRGTLVIQAIGDNKGGHGANFVGFGTDEFEGVKVQGTSEPLSLVFTNPSPPGYYVQLIRTGTVSGWPTT